MTNEPADRIAMLRGAAEEPALLVRRLESSGSPVLYVHGATFPSSLSVAYRFAGRAWMDDLGAAGFDTWAFDFAGFGGSERPREMRDDANGPPIGRTPDAADQVARVIDYILATTHRERVSLIAHSWGTIPACLCATRFPTRVDKLCLFAPVVCRDTPNRTPADAVGRWRLVTIAQQLARFTEDLPPGHSPVLIEPTLARWGPAYLASDPDAAGNNRAARRVSRGVPTLYVWWLVYLVQNVSIGYLIIVAWHAVQHHTTWPPPPRMMSAMSLLVTVTSMIENVALAHVVYTISGRQDKMAAAVLLLSG